VHHPEAGSQTATHRSHTASSYSPTVKPLARLVQPKAPGTETLGPISGT
jgi:hypothetical protein